MIKYIFAVLFFVSHAIPAGSQPATHDGRPPVNTPASPTDKPIKLENIDAFEQERSTYSEENSGEYKQFRLRGQKINMRAEKVMAALEEINKIINDLSNIPEIQMEDYEERILMNEELIKNYGSECLAYESCKELRERANILKRLKQKLEQKIKR